MYVKNKENKKQTESETLIPLLLKVWEPYKGLCVNIDMPKVIEVYIKILSYLRYLRTNS